MTSTDVDSSIEAILAANGVKKGPVTNSSNRQLHMGHSKSHGPKEKIITEGAKCSYCGNLRHTHENCFKLNGYPDWWHEL